MIKIKAILFSTIMALFFSCSSDMERIKTITSITGLPTQTAINIEIIQTDSSKITLTIKAPQLDRFDKVDEPYSEFPKGLEVEFYNDDEKPDSKLTANYAIKINKTSIWEAKHNVVATNRDGTILNTELLFWDEEKEIIYTDKFVKVIEGESILYGIGFESNQDFTIWTILNPTGQIFSEE